METLMELKKEITTHHLTQENKVDFIQADKAFILSENLKKEINDDSNIILFTSAYGTVTGYCILKPLFSNYNIRKQAVLLVDFWGTDRFTIKEIICESVKYSWEVGFHVAFAIHNHTTLFNVGFEQVTKFKIKDMSYENLLGMELSWDGYKKTSRTLINKIPYTKYN